MVGSSPVGVGLREGATSSAFAVRAVAIGNGIYHYTLYTACKQTLAKFLNGGIRETGADGDLRWYALFVSSAYQFPAFLQQRATFEALEIGLVIGLNGDGEPGIGDALQ